MSTIASTATVDPTAELGEGVVVGPGCVIGPGVVIGSGSELGPNVVIATGTTIGEKNRLFANCVLGCEPQFIGCVEPDTKLVIGDNNTLRENVTINRGSPIGGGETVVGNNNYLMTGAHLGHDSQVEDNVMIGNYVQISGHTRIERNVWINAMSGTHQFVTVGRFVYAGGLAGMTADIPPFMKVSGSYPWRIRGLNAVGLQRGGVSEESIAALQEAYRLLYRRRGGRSLASAVEELAAREDVDENVRYLIESIRRSQQHRMGRYLEQFRH